MIKVTAEHIRKSISIDGEMCMVALAVKEEYPDQHVFVGVRQLKIGQATYFVPTWVTDLINQHMEGKVVEPFEFELVQVLNPLKKEEI
jgi:hypothetical protein